MDIYTSRHIVNYNETITYQGIPISIERGYQQGFKTQADAAKWLMNEKEGQEFLANIMEYGNTSAASIPILLSESVGKGLIKLDGSQTILLSGFGGGLTWGSLIVKI